MKFNMIATALIFKCLVLASLLGAANSSSATAVSETTPSFLMPTMDFPPIAIHGAHSAASGIGVEIVREIAKRTGVTLKEKLIQVGEMKAVTEATVSLIPMLARNPERESQYRWVGKILEDRYCFATLKDKPVVSTVAEANALKSIGVNAGGATEFVMKKLGFKNLDTALGNLGSIRKLQAHVIDAWFTSERVAFYSFKNEGKDPHSIVCSGDFGHPEYWIAASRAMPEAQFEKFKSTFAELGHEGFIAHVIKKFE